MRTPLFFILLFPLFMSSGEYTSPDIEYLRTFLPTAKAESARSGIPVSIKLAQALVESNGGESILARRANNHFGIKCKSNWNGPRYFYTDDDKDANGNLVPSCFRMYESAENSYRDHTDFLMASERYDALFNIPATDYVAWANGLMKCGYATDPGYAKKLIRVIERFELYAYDR